MQGQILQADAATQGGIILGDDGNRYRFRPADWRGVNRPEPGLVVDFIASGDDAHEIFPLPSANMRPTPTVVVQTPTQPTGGNSVLLGGLGIVCLVLSFVIPIIPTIAALILGLVGADSAKRHKDGTGLVLSRIAWIGALVLMIVGIALVAFGLVILRDFMETVMRDFRFEEFFRNWNETIV